MVSAVVGVVGGLIGGNKQANAVKDASYLQAEAANSDRALQKEMYEQNRADTMPWLEEGKTGLTKLSDLVGTSGRTTAEGYGSLLQPFTTQGLYDDPGYQFRLDQGMKALERTQSSRGGLLSGAAGKAALNFGQGLASQEYGNAYDRYNQNQTNVYNRISNMAGLGQTANTALTSQGQNYANQAGQAGMNSATAQGNAGIGSANAWNSGLSSISSGLGSLGSAFMPNSPTTFQRLLYG